MGIGAIIISIILACSNQPYIDQDGVLRLNVNCVATIQTSSQARPEIVPFQVELDQVTFVKINPETEPAMRHPNQAFLRLEKGHDDYTVSDVIHEPY